MSSVFSTILNFSILGLLRRLHQINIQHTLQVNSQGLIRFPSMEKHCSKDGKNKLSESSSSDISDEEIAEAVQRAKTKARATLEALDMHKLSQVHSVWDNDNATEDLLADVNAQDDNDDDNEDDDIGNIDHEKSNPNDSLAVIEEVCLDTQEQIANDIQSAYNGGLVNKEAKEKLERIQKVLPVEKVPSETIPMYSLKDHGSLDHYISSLSTNAKQVYTPFVEVNVKGHAVLIRKATAIWLFQETERVSADRLFRVRLKQPYASICTSKSASTAVVQCDDITGKDGLKNSKNDEDITGKDDLKNSKSDDDINIAGKDDLKNSKSDNITGKDDITGNENSKSDQLQMAHECNTIVINDDSDGETSNKNAQTVEICIKSSKWLKIGSYVLNFAEREMLCNNKWLTDLHMNCVQVLLKSSFHRLVDCKTLLCCNQAESQSRSQLTRDPCRLCMSTTIIGLFLQP